MISFDLYFKAQTIIIILIKKIELTK